MELTDVENNVREYYRKWLGVIKDTTPLDKNKVRQLITKLYKVSGIPKPEILFFQSPWACVQKGLTERDLYSCIRLDSYLWDRINPEMGWQISWKVDREINQRIKAQWPQSRLFAAESRILSHIESSIRQLWSPIRSKMELPKRRLFSEMQTQQQWQGQYNTNQLGFYDFYNEVLGVKLSDERFFNLLKEITIHTHLFLTSPKKCFVSERPIKLCLNNADQLHKDGGPAIQYADGFSVWALNGVRVSAEIAETPAEKLDVTILLKERNAEIRREIIRKVGVEKVCLKLGAKCIDKQGNYELLLLPLNDKAILRPYLKMINPSIGVYHIEGVHPYCRTVADAIKWRNQTEDIPVALT